MARPVHARATGAHDLPEPKPRPFLRLVHAFDTESEPDPAKPVHGVPPSAIVIAVIAAAWFVFAMTVGFYGAGDGNYVLLIAVGFAVIFFGLVLGLAARAGDDPRWGKREASLMEYEDDNVAIATGVVSGREAMIQVLTLPVTLAVGATAIAIVFWLTAG